MRIISSFHDYYDPVMRHGMDRECVYVRETVEIDIKGWHRSSSDYPRHYIVGFCGELFPILAVRHQNTYRVSYFHEVDGTAFEPARVTRMARRRYRGRYRTEEPFLAPGTASRYASLRGLFFGAPRARVREIPQQGDSDPQSTPR